MPRTIKCKKCGNKITARCKNTPSQNSCATCTKLFPDKEIERIIQQFKKEQ